MSGRYFLLLFLLCCSALFAQGLPERSGRSALLPSPRTDNAVYDLFPDGNGGFWSFHAATGCAWDGMFMGFFQEAETRIMHLDSNLNILSSTASGYSRLDFTTTYRYPRSLVTGGSGHDHYHVYFDPPVPIGPPGARTTVYGTVTADILLHGGLFAGTYLIYADFRENAGLLAALTSNGKLWL